jgi:hypothetical protein
MKLKIKATIASLIMGGVLATHFSIGYANDEVVIPDRINNDMSAQAINEALNPTGNYGDNANLGNADSDNLGIIGG